MIHLSIDEGRVAYMDCIPGSAIKTDSIAFLFTEYVALASKSSRSALGNSVMISSTEVTLTDSVQITISFTQSYAYHSDESKEGDSGDQPCRKRASSSCCS